MAGSERWVFTLLVIIGFILLWAKWRWLPSATHRVHPKPSPRPLKPRTPDDCPECRITPRPRLLPASTSLKPYSQIKSPRGRRKRIATAGFACPNSDCLYYGITDEQIHALVKVLAPDCLPIFTSDGLKLYFYALTSHFGSWVESTGRQTRHWQVRAQLLYGQLTKHYRRRRLVRVERRALLGSLDQRTAALRSSGDAKRAPFRPPSSNG